jgi:hypothetical protein
VSREAIDLHWHDLRHEGARRLLADGVDIRIIQLMLGHASVQQTQRYWNVTDEELRRGLEAADAEGSLGRSECVTACHICAEGARTPICDPIEGIVDAPLKQLRHIALDTIPRRLPHSAEQRASKNP